NSPRTRFNNYGRQLVLFAILNRFLDSTKSASLIRTRKIDGALVRRPKIRDRDVDHVPFTAIGILCPGTDERMQRSNALALRTPSTISKMFTPVAIMAHV